MCLNSHPNVQMVVLFLYHITEHLASHYCAHTRAVSVFYLCQCVLSTWSISTTYPRPTLGEAGLVYQTHRHGSDHIQPLSLSLSLICISVGQWVIRVATAQGKQGKQGIWFLLFPDRENTGNFVITQGKFLRHRENIFDCIN